MKYVIALLFLILLVGLIGLVSTAVHLARGDEWLQCVESCGKGR